MYTFHIKETRNKIDAAITRALLALAGVAALVVTKNSNYWINIVAAAILFLAAIFIEILLEKLTFKKKLFLPIACIVLFIATGSILFAFILFLVGILASFFTTSYHIHFTLDHVSIENGLFRSSYQWNEFSNILVKDELITLDFKNNRLLQLMLDVAISPVNEIEFNDFCSSCLNKTTD
jgi:hypothetical protein